MPDAKETTAALLAGLAVARGVPFGRTPRLRKVCGACREEIQTGQGYRVVRDGNGGEGVVHARCPQAAPEAAGGGGGGGVCPEG